MTEYFWHFADWWTEDPEHAFDMFLVGSWRLDNYVEINEILDLFFIEDE